MARETNSEAFYREPQRSLPDALGQSEAFLDFQSRLAAVAPVERPVLLIGERGTGKELAAARLHFLSKRWGSPMISLNCAALSQNLIESELFGHEPGAFTGATGRRQGRFEMADGGTLFLDELGLVPLAVQEKILRVTEYGSFERVGGSESINVDVRLIGATNADLTDLVQQDKFKPDLLDRLSFEVLHVPPLRVRTGDVMLLARHFAARMSMELGLPEIPEISEKAIEQMETHRWPGNVRELKNVVERAVYRSGGEPIESIGFEPFVPPWSNRGGDCEPPAPGEVAAPDLLEKVWADGLSVAKEELERRALAAAMDRCGKQTAAAEMLGLSYHQFRALYRRLNADD